MTGLLLGGPEPSVALGFGESALEHPLEVVVRLLVAFVLSYTLGYERELRGSPAGERTFSLIGVGSALVGLLAGHGSPNALVGAVTGIGFIGGGLVFRVSTQEGDVLRGITTAAAIFAAATIGSACGEGFLISATLGDALLLLVLEFGRIPGLKILDARRWADRFDDDEEYRGLPRKEGPNPVSRREADEREADKREADKKAGGNDGEAGEEPAAGPGKEPGKGD
ncbi:MAG TPA: MgtC/SapB family protein [Rugosimonospora sp.]